MVGFDQLSEEETARLRQSSPWAITFGVLGNIIGLMVFLAPLPTFRRIYRNKSTEWFECEQYLFALLSALFWLSYACLKKDFSLLSISIVGCLLEMVYIVMFLIYAPRGSKFMAITNMGLLGVIVASIFAFSKGSLRLEILGRLCVGFTVPAMILSLHYMRLVILTKNLEFLSLYVSCFLTPSAVVWLCYGLFTHDKWVAVSSIMGFISGFLEIVLYAYYRKSMVETTEQTSRDTETTMGDS